MVDETMTDILRVLNIVAQRDVAAPVAVALLSPGHTRARQD